MDESDPKPKPVPEPVRVPEAVPGRWSDLLKLHVPFVLALTGCLFAGWFELTRALAGREVAWVYAFEWPLFAALGTNIWWRQRRGRVPRRAAAHDPAKGPGLPDPALAQWNAYLAHLRAVDPPGGPSSER